MTLPQAQPNSLKVRVLSVFGTRPEAIKMAPDVQALADMPEIDGRGCVTAKLILDPFLQYESWSRKSNLLTGPACNG